MTDVRTRTRIVFGQRIFAYAFAASLTSCATMFEGIDALDMRCQNVSDRIAMHEGEPWLVEANDSPGASAKAMYVHPKQPITSMYCSKTQAKGGEHISFRYLPVEEQKLFAFDDQAAQKAYTANFATYTAKVMENRTRQCHAPPDDPVSAEKEKEIPTTAANAAEQFLRRKEVFLSQGALKFGGDGKRIPLQLLYEGLNCRRPFPKSSSMGYCGNRRVATIVQTGKIVQTKCLQDIVDTRSEFQMPNLLGIVDGRFCLTISVVEEKPGDNWIDSKPTEISRDALSIDLWCYEHDGPISPGVVIGGPKANFRAPALEAK